MMKVRHFMILAVLSLACVPGCTEEQLADVDKALADANSVGEGLRDFVEGPAGAVFPPIVRMIMEIFGVTAAVALGLWKQIRHNLTKDALKAVTKGVESLDDAEKKAEVKELILSAMEKQATTKRTETYAKLNAEVDRAKA